MIPTPQKIRQARKLAGFTQKAAAELVAVHPSTWREWESGRRQINAAAWHLFLMLNEIDPAQLTTTIEATTHDDR